MADERLHGVIDHFVRLPDFSPSELQRSAADTDGHLLLRRRALNSPVAIFIDGVDEYFVKKEGERSRTCGSSCTGSSSESDRVRVRRMLLSDETRREFAERGYIVVPAVLSPREVGAAMIVVDDFVAQTPPPDGHRGHHFYWPALAPRHPLLSLLLDGAAFDVAEQLIRPGRLEVPRQAQVALNIPPYDHRPGRGHLDGATPPEPDGRPGTFTMLAGLLLTDQTSENAGNLWVWPGTHRAHEAHFRERGPDALLPSRGLPDITLPAPEQVLGRAGDLLLAHYMLSHNIGGNTSPNVRRVIYYRLQREGHRDRWCDCVQDALLEFDAVRAALATA